LAEGTGEVSLQNLVAQGRAQRKRGRKREKQLRNTLSLPDTFAQL